MEAVLRGFIVAEAVASVSLGRDASAALAVNPGGTPGGGPPPLRRLRLGRRAARRTTDARCALAARSASS
jgi:hypothetical protein